jgi:DNA-directed RNA polymerase subunit RPC12/RpoP
MTAEFLEYKCIKCGKTGTFENWPASPYKAEEQPIEMVCEQCAMWNNYEVTGGRVKGVKLVVTQQY